MPGCLPAQEDLAGKRLLSRIKVTSAFFGSLHSDQSGDHQSGPVVASSSGEGKGGIDHGNHCASERFSSDGTGGDRDYEQTG